MCPLSHSSRLTCEPGNCCFLQKLLSLSTLSVGARRVFGEVCPAVGRGSQALLVSGTLVLYF